jgi:hypothetical protein
MAEIYQKTLSRGTKYYRVILSGIDAGKETPDTFALKLSMQIRAPITRIKGIVRNLPAPIKSGLDLSQARKFSSVLEQLGGKTKIESYYSQPGESGANRDGQRGTNHPRAAFNAKTEAGPVDVRCGAAGTKICACCGWENSDAADYCEFCHGKFDREEPPTALDLKEQVPEENPLTKPDSNSQNLTLWDFIQRHKIAFLIGLNVLLILLFIIRR